MRRSVCLYSESTNNVDIELLKELIKYGALGK